MPYQLVTDGSPKAFGDLAHMMARQADLLSQDGEADLAAALRCRARTLLRLGGRMRATVFDR